MIDLDAPPPDLRVQLEALSFSELRDLCIAYDLSVEWDEKSYYVAKCLHYVSGELEFTSEALEILLGPFASRTPRGEESLRKTITLANGDAYSLDSDGVVGTWDVDEILGRDSGFDSLNAPRLTMDSPIADWNFFLNGSSILGASFQRDISFSELEQSYVKASHDLRFDLKIAVSIMMILGIVSAISLLIPKSEEFQQGVIGLICVGLLFFVGGAFVGTDSVVSMLVRDFRSSREATERLARLRSQIEESPQFDTLHINPMQEFLDVVGCDSFEQYILEANARSRKWHHAEWDRERERERTLDANKKKLKESTFESPFFQLGHRAPSARQKEKAWTAQRGQCVCGIGSDTDLEYAEGEIPELRFEYTLHPTLTLVLRCNDCSEVISTEAESPSRSRAVSSEVRRAVWLRDEGRCVDCGATEDLEFDHIIPFSKGGSNSENNIQILCRICNGSKRDRIQ